MDLEWVREHLSAAAAAHAANRLPHALLIHAAAGVGGEWLARRLAMLVLCKQPGSAPCGTCPSCQRIAVDQHPDVALMGLEEDSRQIRIEQVRALGEELALTSHQGGYKVGIVSPADALNRHAANALLKTLEEPPPRTLLALVAGQPSRLPSTIISRCQLVRIRPPSRTQSLQWLERMRGPAEWDAVLDVVGEAPLRAAELDPSAIAKLASETRQGLEDLLRGRGDPASLADRWGRTDPDLRLACIENWLTDRIRRGAGGADESREMRAGTHLPPGDTVLNIRQHFELLDSVHELKGLLDTPINRSLALESILRRLLPARAARATPAAPLSDGRRDR